MLYTWRPHSLSDDNSCTNCEPSVIGGGSNQHDRAVTRPKYTSKTRKLIEKCVLLLDGRALRLNCITIVLYGHGGTQCATVYIRPGTGVAALHATEAKSGSHSDYGQ